MSPLQVAAQFAAYVWYSEAKAHGRATPREARRFAGASWEAFLPVAHEGLGRLLLQINQAPTEGAQKSRRRRRDAVRGFSARAAMTAS